MATLYERKNEGYDERQQYTNAAMAASQYNAQSPAIMARGHGESLRARYGDMQDRRALQHDTFKARSIEAAQALQNIQNWGGQLGAQAFQDAQRTGDWNLYNNRLASVGQWQNQAIQNVGQGAMRQFRAPTMANFQRQASFSNVMNAAQARTSDQLRQWAAMGMGLQNKLYEQALDEQRFNYQMQRDAQGDAFRAAELEQRLLDRQNDMAWRWMQYERQRLMDEHRMERDRKNFRMDREESLLRRGHSPLAVENWRRGDRTLLDQELEQGLPGGGLGGRGRGSGTSGGRTGDMSAEDRIYMEPTENRELIDTILAKEGFADVFQTVDPETEEPVLDEDARMAFDQQLPISFERTGDKRAALRDAIRTVAPERYGTSVMNRFGIGESPLLKGRDIGGKVAESAGMYEELGADPEDADMLAAGGAFMSALAAAFQERGDAPDMAQKKARGILDASYGDFAKQFDRTLEKYRKMEESGPETNRAPALVEPKRRGRGNKRDRGKNKGLGNTLDSMFLEAVRTGQILPNTEPALAPPKPSYTMGERNGKRITGRISMSDRPGRILYEDGSTDEMTAASEPDGAYRPITVGQTQWREGLAAAARAAFPGPPRVPETGTALNPARPMTEPAPEPAMRPRYDHSNAPMAIKRGSDDIERPITKADIQARKGRPGHSRYYPYPILPPGEEEAGFFGTVRNWLDKNKDKDAIRRKWHPYT